MKMATMLVDSLQSDWDPKRYHDTFTEDLRERIAAKGSGKTVAADEAETPKAEVLDLMAALSERSSDARQEAIRKSSRSAKSRRSA